MSTENFSKTAKGLLATSLALGLSFNSMAQTSTASSKSLLESLREAPVGLSVEVDSYTHNKEDVNYIDGYTQDIYPYLSYKLSENDSLRYNPVLTFKKTSKTDTEFMYFGSTFRYLRSNVLTEAQNGVGLSLGARLNHFGSSDKNATDSYGSVSLRANFSKNVTSAFSLASTLRFDQYVNSDIAKDDNTVRARKFGVYFTPAYQLTEKLSVSNLFYYAVNTDNTTQTSNFGSLEIIPTVTYAFTPRLRLAAYWDAVPVVGGTGPLLEDNWEKQASWGLLLSYSAF